MFDKRLMDLCPESRKYIAGNIVLQWIELCLNALMIGLIAISVLMLLFVWKNGLLEKYGLSAWAKNNRQMLWFIPLWIVASLNLWGGIAVKYPLPGQIFAVVSMALVGFCEELIPTALTCYLERKLIDRFKFDHERPPPIKILSHNST